MLWSMLTRRNQMKWIRTRHRSLWGYHCHCCLSTVSQHRSCANVEEVLSIDFFYFCSTKSKQRISRNIWQDYIQKLIFEREHARGSKDCLIAVPFRHYIFRKDWTYLYLWWIQIWLWIKWKDCKFHVHWCFWVSLLEVLVRFSSFHLIFCRLGSTWLHSQVCDLAGLCASWWAPKPVAGDGRRAHGQGKTLEMPAAEKSRPSWHLLRNTVIVHWFVGVSSWLGWGKLILDRLLLCFYACI